MNAPAVAARPSGWKEVLDGKAKILHQQIASLQRWVEDSGGGEKRLEQLSAPYYDLLRSIYEEDFPLAASYSRAEHEPAPEWKGLIKFLEEKLSAMKNSVGSELVKLIEAKLPSSKKVASSKARPPSRKRKAGERKKSKPRLRKTHRTRS